MVYGPSAESSAYPFAEYAQYLAGIWAPPWGAFDANPEVNPQDPADALFSVREGAEGNDLWGLSFMADGEYAVGRLTDVLLSGTLADEQFFNSFQISLGALEWARTAPGVLANLDVNVIFDSQHQWLEADLSRYYACPIPDAPFEEWPTIGVSVSLDKEVIGMEIPYGSQEDPVNAENIMVVRSNGLLGVFLGAQPLAMIYPEPAGWQYRELRNVSIDQSYQWTEYVKGMMNSTLGTELPLFGDFPTLLTFILENFRSKMTAPVVQQGGGYV